MGIEPEEGTYTPAKSYKVSISWGHLTLITELH